MKVFDFDPAAQARTYAEQGWLHIRAGVTSEFLEHAARVVRSSGALDAVTGRAVQGAKTQYVFDFPADVEWEVDVLDAVAAMSGMDRRRLTLSERHIKAYLPDAEARPEAHKDRFASGIAIGITLAVAPGSHVVLYPDADRTVNPHLTADLRDSLLPEQQPGVVLAGACEVELHDAPGDVMAFPGASVWHLRRNAASTVLLYLKFNDCGCDPLDEDPTTPLRRLHTLRTVHDPGALPRAVPIHARGFDSVGHETGRDERRSIWHVNVWSGGERHSRTVPQPYAALALALDEPEQSGRTVSELAARGAAGLAGQDLVEAVRVLAFKGALDLGVER
jgi:hypothetical protein